MLKQIKWGGLSWYYAQYFEMGRVEWLRNLGFHYKWMEERNYASSSFLNINYKKPARYDDLLTVKTIFKSQRLLRSSLIMKFTMNRRVVNNC
jgi:YbgC/YbaW family acyl-CoA thioester hydrolase